MKGPDLNISIRIEGDQFEQLLQELEKNIEEGMREMHKEIEQIWRSKAAQTLHKSLDKYNEGLSFELSGYDTLVKLEGYLPVGIETGAPRFDMKSGLLQNKNPNIIPLEGNTGAKEFRTVSSNSAPDSWWHPGLQARAISQQVMEELDSGKVEEIFTPFITRKTV